MINLKYKKKYLKYKYKYLELKNQLGGVKFNNDLTECLNNGDNKHYDAKENKCCKDTEFKNCGPHLPHTIYHSQIPSESSLDKKVYEFNKNIVYTGHNIINKHAKISLKIVKNGNNHTVNVCESFTTNTGLNYKINKEISSGAYGIVIQYYDPTNYKYIAVKYGSINDDIKVISKMKESCSALVIGCVVYSYTIKDIHQFCIIMENAVGTIDELIPIIKSNPNILVDILYAVAIAIKCLQNIGLYYTQQLPIVLCFVYPKQSTNNIYTANDILIVKIYFFVIILRMVLKLF